MTWLNTTARVLTLVVVLPLVLKRFTPGDVALYLLFMSLMSIQMLTAGGFVPTFGRFVSYVLGGARLEDLRDVGQGGRLSVTERGVDAHTLAAVVGTLRHVFARLVLFSTPLIAAVGTLALRQPIEGSSDQVLAWYAWLVVLAGTAIALFSSQYSALLQGANQIALEQRWAALFALAAAFTTLTVVLIGGGLLELVAVNQFWQVAAFVRLWWLARNTLKRIHSDSIRPHYSSDVLRSIWPSSWRSLIGVAGSAGVTALAGLGFAQVVSGRALAEFLLGLRVMAVLSELSRAPFYSKLPVLNVLRARGAMTDFIAMTTRGMQRSFVTYLLLFGAVPVAADLVLVRIGSSVSFPDISFWCLLGVGMFFERYGAMHLQAFSTTNVIIWHWLNGIAGILWIATMLILTRFLGTLAYPAGMIIAYGMFYAPLAVVRSLRSMPIGTFEFERKVAVPSAAGLLIICTALLLLHGRC